MHPDPSPATSVGTILTAVRSFDQPRIAAILDDAASVHGVDVTVDEVVFASLRVVGTFWSSGTIDVAHEHMLSTAVTRWIAARSAGLPPPYRHGTVVLAAGPQDMHTLALDCLDLMLASRGVQVCNLGAQTPVASLLVAVKSVSASAVVLSSHTPTVASQAVRSVKAIADAGVPVYFAGSSFASQFFRQNTPGVPLDGTLAQSAEMLAVRHTRPPSGPVSNPPDRRRESVPASA